MMLGGTLPAAFVQTSRIEPEQRAQISPLVPAIGWLVAGLVFALQALNAVGWPIGLAGGPYVLCTAMLLMLGGVHFIALLFSRLL